MPVLVYDVGKRGQEHHAASSRDIDKSSAGRGGGTAFGVAAHLDKTGGKALPT